MGVKKQSCGDCKEDENFIHRTAFSDRVQKLQQVKETIY